jgi:hypothetical protein
MNIAAGSVQVCTDTRWGISTVAAPSRPSSFRSAFQLPPPRTWDSHVADLAAGIAAERRAHGPGLTNVRLHLRLRLSSAAVVLSHWRTIKSIPDNQAGRGWLGIANALRLRRTGQLGKKLAVEEKAAIGSSRSLRPQALLQHVVSMSRLSATARRRRVDTPPVG